MNVVSRAPVYWYELPALIIYLPRIASGGLLTSDHWLPQGSFFLRFIAPCMVEHGAGFRFEDYRGWSVTAAPDVLEQAGELRRGCT